MALMAYGVMRGFRGDPIGGLWLVFIGLFLHSAARSSEDLVAVRTQLERFHADEVMEPPARDDVAVTSPEPAVDPKDTAWTAFLRLARSKRRRVRVMDHGKVVGVIDHAGLHAAVTRAQEAERARAA